MAAAPDPWVIIVGAGPSGLLLGLLLAQRGIAVHLIDQTEKLDEQPRATHYAMPAVSELRRAGVTDDMRAAGFIPNTICWRKLDGTYLTGLDSSVFGDHPDRMICLPLNKLGQILYNHLKQCPSAMVSWGQKVVSVGQDENTAWVDVETPEGRKTLHAKYIVGCDGANSQVRRSLFGDLNFPGKTWDEQIVATNTYYDFEKFGWEDSNFIIHPEHWYMAAKITNDGLYRVTYGELPGLTNEELRQRQPEKFRTMLPGHPEPEEYKIVNFSPYRIHQRLAPSMRVGRFCLAADAAHLCNPFGGMGLTSGIVDVGGLFDCLFGIHEGVADESILDKYSEIRRQKYHEMIDPISTANILRLFDQDPDKALEDDQFLQILKRGEDDHDFAREVQLGINQLNHDFTQYYRQPLRAGGGDKLAGTLSPAHDIPAQAAAIGVAD